MASEKNGVLVKLYDLSISNMKGYSRVVTGKSSNEDDLIQIAISRRTDHKEPRTYVFDYVLTI
jgi:hypothetical protein